MRTVKLQTFQLVVGNKPISDWLITTREYGRFMRKFYDERVCSYELFKQESKKGEPLMVYHPGSKIGKFFDNQCVTQQKYMSTFFKQGCSVLDKLYDMELANPNDFNYISVNGSSREKLLRAYTPDAIELYIRTCIDRDFTINPVLMKPKQIKVLRGSLDKIIFPQCDKSRKSLLDITNEPVHMTVEDIEKKLKCKIAIVSEEEKNERIKKSTHKKN